MRIAILSIASVVASSFAIPALSTVSGQGAAHAQPVIATSPKTADAQARALYFDARAQANSGNYAGAVRLLDRAIALLGQPKKRLMPVLIDSLHKLQRYERASIEARRYLVMKPIIKTREYLRIAALVSMLERKAVEHKRRTEDAKRNRERQQRAADEAAWRRAMAGKTSHSYRYYVQRFPNGMHVAEARRLMSEAKRREDQAQLERQRRQQEQRLKYKKRNEERQIRYKIARAMRDDAKSMKSSSSLYYSTGILAIVGGGSAFVLLDDKTSRGIGAVAVVGGGLLLYLGQSRINKSKRLMREADDIQNNRKPLPPISKVVVSPWLGPKKSYGLALGARF